MTTDKQRLELFENLTRELIRKMDVVLPKLTGIAVFHAVRSGNRGEPHGPVLAIEIEQLRELLGLPNPAATERDYWPKDWCRNCDGSGKVMPTKGIHPYGRLQSAGLYLASVRDEEEAIKILLETPVRPDTEEDSHFREDVEKQRPAPYKARKIIANLDKSPLYLKGEQIYRLRYAWTEAFMKADATFVYIRQCVWPVFDACPECKGTANRGLKEAVPWYPDSKYDQDWPEGEVIFQLDRGETWEEFEKMWHTFNKRELK